MSPLSQTHITRTAWVLDGRMWKQVTWLDVTAGISASADNAFLHLWLSYTPIQHSQCTFLVCSLSLTSQSWRKVSLSWSLLRFQTYEFHIHIRPWRRGLIRGLNYAGNNWNVQAFTAGAAAEQVTLHIYSENRTFTLRLFPIEIEWQCTRSVRTEDNYS